MDTNDSRSSMYGPAPSGRREPRKFAMVPGLVLALGVASTAAAGSGRAGVVDRGER